MFIHFILERTALVVVATLAITNQFYPIQFIELIAFEISIQLIDFT